MIRFYTLLLLSLFFSLAGSAQNYVNYDKDTRWFIGFNGGATWTTKTEVPYQVRGGYGVTFGKSFGMEPDKVFNWDWRARFLYAQIQGQAKDKYNLDSASMSAISQIYGESSLNQYKDSLGYFIPNYRSNLLRGSLELVLNTNKLREETGWNISVFGGIGLTAYHTATDIKNANGDMYDYQNAGSFTKANLVKFQDGTYETDLNGTDAAYKLDVMPSFGFGISKQLSPWLALGLEHKMTWTRTDNFDGMPVTFDGMPSPENDIYHYTAATLKFHLFNGSRRVQKIPDVDIYDKNDGKIDGNVFDNTPVVNDSPVRKKPIVEIYDPATSPYTTNLNTFKLKANIYYVKGKADITFKQDGIVNTNFMFNATTNKFESQVALHPGQNLFEITGVNEAGSDYAVTIIIYKGEVDKMNPPIVAITNPPYSPYTVNSNVFGLVSTVLNVDAKAQIQVYFNGVVYNSFNYNLASKVLNASLNLQEGTNTVTITATNAAGSDSKTIQLIYKKSATEQPPIIDFINPGVDPYYTSTASINIKATALNIEIKSNIVVKVNGNIITSFSFNTTTKEINFPTALLEGANSVEIKGTNNVGFDYATTTIIYARPGAAQPPIVTFLDPGINPMTVYSNSYNVTAKVEYVDGAKDITLKINGVKSTYFTYSPSSDLMNFTTSLVEGSNVIEVKGVSVHGFDLATTTIIYKKTIPQAPPIVTITNPAKDYQVYDSPALTLAANVLNVSDAANIHITVNGATTHAFTYNVYTKVLNLPVVLKEGVNTVKITGTNVVGSDSDTRIINYKKPLVAIPPTVAFVNPPSSPHLVGSAAFTVKANTTNISDKSQITLKQNGVLITDAAYSLTAGKQLIYNATLISGNNIFEVFVANADGSADDLAIVNYTKEEAPCIIPTVGYVFPVPYSTVSDPAVKIDAQINNHSPGTTVELKLNGVSKGYIIYNEETSIASKSILLTEGSNAINIVVTNACGTNQATFTLNYLAADAPCDFPTVTAIGATTITTLADKISLTASSSHIGKAGELSVQLNGSNIPFVFDAGTGAITIPTASLKLGTNSIVIKANTACGTTVLVYTVTREECKLPLITAVSPSSGATVETESIAFKATLSNTASEDIILLVNGVSQAFVYNAESKIITASVALTVGTNTLVLTGVNACGDATKTIIITRKIPCESIITNLLVPASNTITVTNEKYDLHLNATGLTNVDQIKVTLNGVSVSPTFDPITGNVSVDGLKLKEGANAVIINMANACSESKISYTITYEGCKTPVIYFSGIGVPVMIVTESTFDLNATIANVSNPAEIVLNVNGVITDFTFDAKSNLLTATVLLKEGTNTFELTVNGCEVVKSSATVKYEVPCPIISYKLMAPSSTTRTVVESAYAITVSTFGVGGADEITVTQNGKNIPFAFNAMTKIINVSGITLVNGANEILVSLKNACSGAVILYEITYDDCLPPVITRGDIPTEVTEIVYTYEANISNIEHADAISLLVNGAPVEFVFNPITGSLIATLILDTAVPSTIVLTAKGCETVTDAIEVKFTRPCSPITYTLGSPATLSNEVKESSYTINLIVLHASSINVKVNGVTRAFTYADNLLSIHSVKLKEGVNTINVNMNNECSSESIVYTITKNDCTTPTIDLSENLVSSDVPLYSFKANVQHIERADQIQVVLNGSPIKFDFNAEMGVVNGKTTLKEGENTLVVKLTSCANTTGTLTVQYLLPCKPVTYSLMAPSELVSKSENEMFALSLKVSNIVDASRIKATLNGEIVLHTFESNVIKLTGLKLLNGANNIGIAFGNTCSEESVSYTVHYNECIYPPTIMVNDVTDGMVMEVQEFVYRATVSNIYDAGDIKLKLNGVAVPFAFDVKTSALTAEIKLAKLANSIVLVANGCEMVTDKITLNYNESCIPPAYKRGIPTTSVIEVEDANYTLSLTTYNVTADQISATLNGENVPFKFASGSLVFNLTLAEKSNALLINLKTDCGSERIAYTITYAPKEVACSPVIKTDFAPDNLSVKITSDKELINVMLGLSDGSRQFIDGLAGFKGVYEPTGAYAGKCITGIWVRSGCNLSAAGEPYGDYIVNPGWDGKCVVPVPCEDVTYSLISPVSFSAVSKTELYNIVMFVNNLENVKGVEVFINGLKSTANLTDNKLTIPALKLISGSNTIQVNLKNACSSKKLIYTISYSPVVKIEDGVGKKEEGGFVQPDNGGISGKDEGSRAQMTTPIISPVNPTKSASTVTTSTIPLKVKVENVKAKADIVLTVNGTNLTNFNFSVETNFLNTVVNLNKGVNLIKITANNGKMTEFVYYITYNPPAQNQVEKPDNNSGAVMGVPSPVFERVNPTNSSHLTMTDSYLLKVKVLNINNKSDLMLHVNGVSTANFAYNQSTNVMSAALKLTAGNNTVKVTAKNASKTVVIEYVFKYTPKTEGVVAQDNRGNVAKPQTFEKPVFKLINPAGNTATVSTEMTTIKVIVQHVNALKDFTVLLNKENLTSFTFNPNTKELVITAKMKIGDNEINVRATNGNQQETLNYILKYTPPKAIVKPQVGSGSQENGGGEGPSNGGAVRRF